MDRQKFWLIEAIKREVLWLLNHWKVVCENLGSQPEALVSLTRGACAASLSRGWTFLPRYKLLFRNIVFIGVQSGGGDGPSLPSLGTYF